MNNHKFHMVNNSPWPVLISFSMLLLTTSAVVWMHKNNPYMLIMSLILTIMLSSQWWRDIIRESTFQGIHNKKIIKLMKWGMMMFILSEIMFFISFFWTFFHMSLSPSIEMGLNWPPMGIEPMKPMNIPLLNTVILMSSGVSITLAHNFIMNKMLSKTIKMMWITIFLGVYFSIIQLYEYMECSFSISDSVFGSTFFLMTGFHGIHVIIGTMFLIVSTIRLKMLHFTKNHMVGYEASAWYWHFVDIIWLMLYISVYWWGM
uniref:cytochrome c oxidase subunit III n=1 Tax=Batracomorphus nigromarginattus TaxID=1962548 RepID=UPI00257D88CB|nr:cytochrome c oxidase subunit III [Batracomorphus nigromarginattus]WHE42669.1 cytochrome c oxidase subunit 3 [Batracomorphus nigromarginattus]